MASMSLKVAQRSDIIVVPGRIDPCIIGSRVAAPLSGTIYIKYSQFPGEFHQTDIVVVTGVPAAFSDLWPSHITGLNRR